MTNDERQIQNNTSPVAALMCGPHPKNKGCSEGNQNHVGSVSEGRSGH